jgi:putative ABC transport system permease protein
MRNFFQLISRNFRKNFLISVINLTGLSTSLACVMLIVSFIIYELSFDRHYSNFDRIYQIVLNSRQGSLGPRTVQIPEPIGSTMQQELGEIEATTCVAIYQRTFLVKNLPHQLKIIKGNPSFFKIFNFKLLYGTAVTVFRDASTIVLSESIAKKLFPGRSAIGETLMSYGTNYIVSGIMEDIPSNTHFSADAVIQEQPTSDVLTFEGYSAIPQYVLVKKNVDVDKLKQKLPSLFKKYGLGSTGTIELIPVTDVRLLTSDVVGSYLNQSDKDYVYIMGCVAFLILAMGCVNYINLTTAQSMGRFKEIGIRKVLGSRRIQIFLQLVGESLVFFVVAVLIGAFVAILLGPVFFKFLNIPNPATGTVFKIIIALTIITILSAICSAAYPALIMSRLAPSSLLVNTKTFIGFNFRKTLIVFQFFLSICLTVATFVAWKQLNLLKNRPLGFEKDHLMVLQPMNIGRNQAAFKEMLLQSPNISSVSFADISLGGEFGSNIIITSPNDSVSRIDIAHISADHDFIETLGIKLKSGRNFSHDKSGDLLDSASLSQLEAKGIMKEASEVRKQEPIIVSQSYIDKFGLDNTGGGVSGTIIGVVSDFQLTNFNKATPLIVYTNDTKDEILSTYIRIRKNNTVQSVQYVKKNWEKLFPDKIFQYYFADERIAAFNEYENRLTFLFTIFSFLAIGISSIGLYSLMVLIVRQRSKEIAIRKVIGSSVTQITILLSKEIFVLLSIAIFIATPVALYATNLWLQNYVYQIHVNGTLIFLSCLLVVLVSIFTVLFQAITAAQTNPVKSLKTD